MRYTQIDNLIGQNYLSRLYNLTTGQTGFPWFFLSDDISYQTEAVDRTLGIVNDRKTIGFTHLLLDGDGIESPYLQLFKPLLDSVADHLGNIEFFRVRLALQLNNGKENYNLPHTDHEDDHYAALFYLHDCSGDTVFFNEYDDPNYGTVDDRWGLAKTQKYTECHRVTPKANRLFAFDGHQFHSSSNPNRHPFRVILNLNFTAQHEVLKQELGS